MDQAQPSHPDIRPASLVPDASRVAIAAYAELRTRMVELLAQVDPDVAARTVVPGCPDWSVTDAAAHLAGVCIDIVDGALGDDVGTTAWADSHVTRFSSLGLPAIVARWEETGTVIDTLGGLIPDRIASQFAFDGCTHEHDIRGALGMPGARESSAVHVALGFIESMLDGRVRAEHLPALELRVGAERIAVGDGPPAATLSAEPFELFRAFGGRRSVSQITAMDWTGDPAPYLAVFETSPLAPPERPLVE